ncbi:Biorientation of chromosomes in cell division protein 1-like 1 [Oryzias melastigma]|uniref:Biorientation of chromosomes in cell division protein 1-like 1 n=1 Tax=Oryzias melastigma TaxID=30732 RepID=A0A834CBH8_ORYME|nr:Biorientation of chromosomes in cell division protein 1-like 1 [Oryzias melastigma]
MSGLPPGDPQLVSMIVNHLKTQGLFDQFRRECLADVDTKPAYLNLKQRVDNFVSNHLSNHTWSPHLNKNQLRNNIRQLVLQSGMLEQGVDRIVAQVVDPKINHIFRPQVERVVREFLSPGSCSEEPTTPLPPADLKTDSGVLEQASSSTPVASTTSDAMSILDTISSLNQEASVRSSSAVDKSRRSLALDDAALLVDENGQDVGVEDGEENQDRKPPEEPQEMMEVSTSDVKVEETGEYTEPGREGLAEEVKVEEEAGGALEQTEEEKPTSKTSGKPSEEKPDDEVLKSKNQAKQKAKERIKEEYSLEDSDLEGLSDITVSSVHTSDLSSFEEESDEEEQPSDSSEEGELSPDDDGKKTEKKHTGEEQGEEDKERKPCRKAYVHKPFLYSRYYSDSDDEVTVEERRRSVAKDKEERLLKRQQNRERMEEKLKQKAAQAEQQDSKKLKSADSAGLEGPKAKEARKERKVLEKKMALNRKRKLDSRKEGDVSSKKKGDTGDMSKRAEIKPLTLKTPQPKLSRNLSESAASDERHRRTTISEESNDTKKATEKAVTHAFILELEQGSQEALKQRSFGKFDRPSRKELHPKERKDKEQRSLSDDRVKLKQKQEKRSEQQVDEFQHKEGAAAKGSSEEKAEKKLKTKSEKKTAANTKDGKVAEAVVEDITSKEAKKSKGSVEKDKEKREKDKIKEKEKAKGEKSLVKTEFKQLLCPDSAGSSEDRSDLETGPDGTKKKDKHSKEVLKKSKSHNESKLKTESEKEKTKLDQDGLKSHKPSSEPDKEKKVKAAEKGKILEKSKTKSKEEAKAQVSPKTDKKTPSLDFKNAGLPSVSKPEAKKDKKKDVKDQLKASEEAPSDKSGLKAGKKKMVKKDITEKKDEEKVQPPEKSDKSSKVSALTSVAEEPPQILLQDTESITSAGSTQLSEPPEDHAESRLEMSRLPAEADALLTLMDVCASAEARLPSYSRKEEEAVPEAELQDADMKMKEAALTLLSMDPDSTLTSTLICQDAAREEEEPASPLEAPAAEEEPLPAPETHLTFPEASTAALQTESGAEENTNATDERENSERQTEAAGPDPSLTDAAQENADIPTSSNQKQPEDVEVPAESQPDDKEPGDEESILVADVASEEITSSTGSETLDVVPKDTENVCETGSESDQKEADGAVTEPNLTTRMEAEDDQNQTEMDAGDVNAQREGEEDERGAEESDLLTMEADLSERTDTVAAPEPEFPQDKETSEVSVADIQEEESSSDRAAEETPSQLKPSEQEDTPNEESADGHDENETEELQPSAETEEEKGVVEVQTPPSEGISKPVQEEESDQSEELEKPKDSPSSSDIPVTSSTVDDLTTDGGRTEDGFEETQAAEEEERPEDQTEPERSGAEVGPLSSGSEDHERAEKVESTETTEICQSTRKRKMSEETEESAQESQAEKEVKELSAEGGGDSDHPSSVSCSDDVKPESGAEKKPDEGQEKHQDDHETPPKRRRGRPPKAAPVEESDQKKTSEKESEQVDEEEEEDSEKDDEERGSATRATTRLASRLEAERNKPSKPSTRASRQGGKEEAAAGSRGTRGPAAARGGRKREASPPAARTRGGQKSEEPASKRAKR